MRTYLPVALLLAGILAADFFSHESISRASYDDSQPVPSPDGRLVAFESDRDGRNEVYVMPIEGGPTKRLTVTDDPGESRFPRWSPDDEMIVYQSRKSPKDNWQLFIVKRDGSGARKISEEDNSDFEGVVSPDGNRLVFVSTRPEDPPGNSFLCVMNIDGSDFRRVSDSPFEKHGPCWSPDGSRIAYSERSPEGNFEIFSVTVERGRVKQITGNMACDNIQPAWSADGSKVAFVSNRDGHSEIYIMNSDGSRSMRMTRNVHYNSHRPFWSRDGEKIFFDSDRFGSLDVFSIGIDGSNLVRLTRKPESVFVALIRDQGVARAKSVFDAARSEKPDEPLFKEKELTAIGYAFLDENRIDEATEVFKMNAVVYPTPETYSGLSEALKAQDTLAAPTESTFFQVLRMQGIQKAADLYERTQKERPGWVMFGEQNLEKIGLHLAVQKKDKEAMQVFDLLVRAYPKSPAAYVHRANLLLIQRNKKEAVDNLKKAVMLDPTDRKVTKLLKSLVKK